MNNSEDELEETNANRFVFVRRSSSGNGAGPRPANNNNNITTNNNNNQLFHNRRSLERNSSSSSTSLGPISPAQRAFWQAITVGELETVEVLLQHRAIDINRIDETGEQRAGCAAIHLAILEMATWRGTEGRNGIQSAEFIRKFFALLLQYGADIELVCRYAGEWYLQTAAGKTKTFFPDGYNSLGLVLQFIEITRGADVISTNVTKRLELIRDMLLKHMRAEGESSLLCEDAFDDANERTLSNDLGAALGMDAAFCDLEIVCEGECIRAHRMVLASRSEVFHAMFAGGFAESTAKQLEVKEVDAASLRLFVEFLYTDKISDSTKRNPSLLRSLLVLANRYDVKLLKAYCSSLLAEYLEVSNACNLLKIADENNAAKLRNKALLFISQNIDAIMPLEDFKKLDSELVQEVLKSVVVAKNSSPLPQSAINNKRIFSTSPPELKRVHLGGGDGVSRNISESPNMVNPMLLPSDPEELRVRAPLDRER